MVLLNEMDPKRPALGLVRIDQGIRNAYLTLQGRLPAAETVTASAGTISSDTFTLPTTSSAEYAGLVWIRLRSTGDFLVQVSMDEMVALRDGNPTIPTARPQFFALYEDATQTVNGMCESSPTTPETYDLTRTLVASDFDLTAIDSTTVALSRLGINALVYQAAGELALSLTDDDLKLRRLNPNVIPLWFKQAEMNLHQESIRRHNIESTGRVQRWVS